VLGHEWIGELPEPGPVLFISAEDDEDEMHFRYAKIARTNGADFDQLADAGLNLLSLAGKDSAMAVADARGIVKATDLFHTMVRTAREIRPRWIGLDTAADIFIVNERDRSQVRQCISLLRGICIEIGTAVILLAHPSLTGISSGSGLSGSTAWNNSVRSRLYLKTEKKKEKGESEDEDDEDANGDSARILEFMKSNYSALAAPVKLVWRDGLLVPEQTLPKLSPLESANLEQRARDLFLDLLKRYNKQDRPVSYKETARNFAPNVFAELDEVKLLHSAMMQRKKLLRKAMDHLLDKGRIETGTGPRSAIPSRRFPCLYAAGSLL
jgi:RecA-family ATPase